MRLELISTFDWAYDENVRVKAPGYELITPFATAEGQAYGEGRGTATGRIAGTAVWSNYPHRRSDERMLPDVRGLIRTDDGASIVFELRGRTSFGDDGIGRQNLVGWFEAEDERYRWLNDVVCIAEGVIDDDGMRLLVYAGVHELEPSPG
jgi:hypothetical protein